MLAASPNFFWMEDDGTCFFCSGILGCSSHLICIKPHFLAMSGPSASTPSQPRWRQGRSPWRIKTHGALELCHQRSPEQVPNKHVGISLIILKNCRWLHHFNCCFWFDHGKTSAETSPRFERDPLQGFTHDFSGSESWLKTEAAGSWTCQEQNC